MKLLLLAVSSILAAYVACARPAQVILLRHAEKPADDSSIHLSPRGIERAQALALYLTTNTTLLSNGPPATLMAAKPTKRRPSRRPIETLSPLATRLKLPIQTPYASEDYEALAARLLASPEYEGKTVIVCWVQDFLPELARALGATPKPKKWASSNYDHVWAVTFERERAVLRNIAQRLLPGDADR